jgi:hypothetical protein
MSFGVEGLHLRQWLVAEPSDDLLHEVPRNFLSHKVNVRIPVPNAPSHLIPSHPTDTTDLTHVTSVRWLGPEKELGAQPPWCRTFLVVAHDTNLSKPNCG